MQHENNESSQPVDFTWQDTKWYINNYLSRGSIPKAFWRVILTENNEFTVIPWGRRAVKSELSDPNKFRKELFSVLVSEQSAYIESGMIQDLRVFGKDQLIKACFKRDPNSPAGKKLKSKTENLSNLCYGQYFYNMRGRLHDFRFLMQDELWGLPFDLVCHEIRNLVEEEKNERVFASDKEFAEKLFVRLPNMSVKPNLTRFRERKVWFPKKSDRQKLYGKT